MTTTPDAYRKYLTRAFELNPCWRAGELIDLRARALKLRRLDQMESKHDPEALSKLRSGAKQQIARLQAEFWKLPMNELKHQLESLDVRSLPDLAAVVKRLKIVAACRGEFPKLSQESWMDRELFQAFKNAIVMPPAEAGYARERFLARIKDKRQLSRVKAAVRRLQTEFPVLFALESDWFATVAKYKLHRASAGNEDNSGQGGFELPGIGWPAWLIIFVILRVLANLMMSSGH